MNPGRTVAFVLAGSTTIGLSLPGLPLNSVSAQDRGQVQRLHLPASYECEAPGKGGLIRRHLDLLPGGHFFLRETSVGKPERNRFDRLGHWSFDRRRRRLDLQGTGGPQLDFTVEENGEKLQPLCAQTQSAAFSSDPVLLRMLKPALVEPHLRLTGMFASVADSPSIVLSDDGWWLPVAMEGDYQTLERAYRQANPKPGETLLVRLDGTIVFRPSPNESRPVRPTLVVERFIAVYPGASCSPSSVKGPIQNSYWKLVGPPLPTDVPLRETYWKLVCLEGRPIDAGELRQEPHLIFASKTPRVFGSGGCNRLIGSFQVDGDRLYLSQIASTRMACPNGGEQEEVFLNALSQVTRYRIQGRQLDLFNVAGTVVATFQAAALREAPRKLPSQP
ncbi:MAG: META domain-containing protein [Candidatus Methylacidiphilaceae bacterium]